MWFCYLLCFFPLIIGCIFWIKSKEISYIEWIASIVASFISTVIINFIVISGMTYDTETWSGELLSCTYFPEWTEEYSVPVFVKGKFSHYKTKYRSHSKYWEAEDNIGITYNIEENIYDRIKLRFGNKIIKNKIQKSGFYSGDEHVYVTKNTSKYIWPVTKTKSFENKVIASPSVFSFSSVPDYIKVFEYPKSNDGIEHSNRLLGNSNDVSILQWDQLNARLGPVKKINLISCGFKENDSMLGKWQEAKWFRGKKNDLVLCHGGADENGIPSWVYVFGWSDSSECKLNIESILLENGLSSSSLDLIEKEIKENYNIKDWGKLDYLTADPPLWGYLVIFLVMIITQIAYWIWSFKNDFRKKAHPFDMSKDRQKNC